MKPPVHRLTKFQIIWLNGHTCKHRHTYLNHYDCYLKENPAQQRIATLDIETTHLKADMGFMLSYCLKVDGEDRILEAVVTEQDLRSKKGDEDRRILTKLIKDLEGFDHIITYYGTGFDLKFLRTRALIMGVPFPHFGALKHTDAFYMVKSRFLMLSSSLKQASKMLVGKTNKTDIDYNVWRMAARGNKAALKEVLHHNRQDVIDTEKLYHLILDYSKRTERSI